MNTCIFEGRVCSDIQMSTVNFSDGQKPKASFSMAIDKGYSSQRRQEEEGAGRPTADFVRISALGPKAEFAQKYLQKGKAIIVHCKYRSWQKQNQQTGQTEYGNNFEVIDFDFVTSDSKSNNGNNQQGGGNNGYQQNNGYSQPAPNMGYQQPQPQQQSNGNNFKMFDEENMPF